MSIGRSELKQLEALIKRRHPRHVQYYDTWEFLRIAREGGNAWKDRALVQYSTDEPGNDFNARKNRAIGNNHVKHVINEKRNLLFRPGVNRSVVFPEKLDDPLKEMWEAFCTNIDACGTSRDDFFRKAYGYGTLYSWVGILVDKEKEEEKGGVETPAITDALLIRDYPYCTIYTPQSILDWSLDKFGSLNWILLRDIQRDDADPMAADSSVQLETYLLWTKTFWRRISVTAAAAKPAKSVYTFGSTVAGDLAMRRGITDPGIATPHHLGAVPFVIYVDTEHPDEPLIGDNGTEEVADVSKGVLNMGSNLQEQIYNTVFSLCVIKGGMKNINKISKLRLGTRIAVSVPSGGGVDFVSPNPTVVDSIQRWIDHEDRTIYQKAKLRSGYGEEKRPERMSGVAHNWDWRITNDEVADDARVMERVEEAVDRLYGKCEKIKGFKTAVKYARNFSVMSAPEALSLWEQARNSPLPKTAMTELVKQTAKNLLPRLDPEKQAAIDAEAEANPTPPQSGGSRLPVLPSGFGLNRELERRGEENA